MAWAADPGIEQTVAKPSHFELSAGGQAFDRVWSLYSGITAAPFGSIQEDGARLRFSGGYGGYRYSGPRAAGTGSQIVDFDGAVTFAEFLIGYQKQVGPVTLKLFGGLMAEDHLLRPDDPETSIRGKSLGAKAVLEAWWTISDRLWASLDLAWGTAHASYGTRVRLGWRLSSSLSAGLEAGAAGNVEGDAVRAGAFLRYEWAAGEVSLSGGVSNDQLLDNLSAAKAPESNAPFISANWLTRF
jgi:cellulose biosynthesis protein BcsS